VLRKEKLPIGKKKLFTRRRGLRDCGGEGYSKQRRFFSPSEGKSGPHGVMQRKAILDSPTKKGEAAGELSFFTGGKKKCSSFTAFLRRCRVKGRISRRLTVRKGTPKKGLFPLLEKKKELDPRQKRCANSCRLTRRPLLLSPEGDRPSP